jgi:hypothetical protein
VNSSLIQVLESEIEGIIISTPEGLISRIDVLASEVAVLETCCEINSSRLDVLESIVDIIGTGSHMVSTETCEILVCGELKFDFSMLPGPSQTVVFRFCKCYNPKENLPSVLFDPAYYGNGGIVPLAKQARMVFTGHGNVHMKDGVQISMLGTPNVGHIPGSDWPEFYLENSATMILDPNAVVTFRGGSPGAGCIRMREGGAINLNQPGSHLIIGEEACNEFLVQADVASQVVVNNPTAAISFVYGIYTLRFDNNSSLEAMQGVIEFNTINMMPAAGYLREMTFTDNSCIVTPGQCGDTFGLIRLALNDPMQTCTTGSTSNVIFNNLTGQVCGHGDLQYLAFDGSGNVVINSVTQIQNNHFTTEQDISQLFIGLSLLLDDQVIVPPEQQILAIQGSIPDQSRCGGLIAFCPPGDLLERDGSFVPLAQGDHDVFYDRSVSCGAFDLIRGYDQYGRVFTIFNCDASTRTPPAPGP